MLFSTLQTISTNHSLLLLGLVGHFPNLLDSLSTVVEGHQVPSPHVETIKVLYRLLRVKDVLVYDEGSSLLVPLVALSDLTNGPESTKNIIELLVGYFVGKVSDKDNFVDLWGQFDRLSL